MSGRVTMSGFQLFLIYDIVVVLLVVIFIILNTKRKFSNVFVTIIGYVVAIVLGSMVGDATGEPLYTNFIQSSNVQDISDVLEKNTVTEDIISTIKKETFGVNIPENSLKSIISSPDKMYSTINGNKGSEMFTKEEIADMISSSINDSLYDDLVQVMPSVAVKYMMNSITSDDDLTYQVANHFVNDDYYDSTLSEYVVSTFIKPIVIYITKGAVFLILFLIVMIITKIINKNLDDNGRLPILSDFLDGFLGAISGIIEAVVLVLLATIVLRLVVLVDCNLNSMFTQDTIQQTMIYKYLYDIVLLRIS